MLDITSKILILKINHKKAREFGSLELLAKQAVEGFITGLHKSPYHGFSVEFAEHRIYNKGESTKHIDWKLYGRTERLFVKRYEEETNLRCQIVIDTSSSMYFPADKYNKIEFSIDASAAIIYMLRKQRDAVGLSLFDEQTHLHTPAKSSLTHQRFLFNELEKKWHNYDKNEQKTTNLTDTLHQVAELTHKRSLIVLFTDVFDTEHDSEELFSALQHLKYRKHEVIIFQTVDRDKEEMLNYDNSPYTFVDMESGESIKINPYQVKDEYQKLFEKKQQEIKLKCAQYHIDYTLVDINEGFDAVLLKYLMKRKKMS